MKEIGINPILMFKKTAKLLLSLLGANLRIKLRGRLSLGYTPNLDKPKTFNEKINYRKLQSIDPLMVTCSDKYAVRSYVEKIVGSKYLIPLLYIGDSITEHDIEQFECDAVVKTTHDSGNVFFINKKSIYSNKTVIRELTKSLKYDFGKFNDEPWYSDIARKVLAEKMLYTASGDVPSDFKFHIFNDIEKESQEVILQVDYGRFTEHTRTFYNENGDILPITNKYKNNFKKLQNIKNFPLMIKIAKQLSKEFSYVRVDLYNVDGVIYFGELTFAHEAGFGKFDAYNTDVDWGNKWGSLE